MAPRSTSGPVCKTRRVGVMVEADPFPHRESSQNRMHTTGFVSTARPMAEPWIVLLTFRYGVTTISSHGAARNE